MAGPALIQIQNGVFGLAVVDPSATGYLPAWQAPGGKTAATAAASDYGASAASFVCQIKSGQLTPSASNTTETIDATFCSPAQEVPNPGVTTYGLELSLFQDPHVRDGLSSFLFQYDVAEAYFLLGLNAGTTPPRAIGRVRVASIAFGGAARTNLSADVTMPLSGKPDILFGSTGSTRLITGAGVVTNNP